jgi:hypothetical protein
LGHQSNQLCWDDWQFFNGITDKYFWAELFAE